VQAPTPPPASQAPLIERLLRHLPGQCAVCHAWSHQQICESCLLRYARIVPRCWSCALRLPLDLLGRREPRCGRCLREPPPLDRAVAALDYQFPWDGLLQQFKYQEALGLRETLLGRLSLLLDEAETEAPDWLLPVPLSDQRLRERGYNQAHELAKGLARRRGLRVDAGLLLRVRHNDRQAQLALDQRAANVRGVFALEPTRLTEVAGRRIALVDDVMTSGATLFEIARVLRRAGAAHVQAWVIARTPEPGE
jgi:ComF family protein